MSLKHQFILMSTLHALGVLSFGLASAWNAWDAYRDEQAAAAGFTPTSVATGAPIDRTPAPIGTGSCNCRSHRPHSAEGPWE